MSSSFFFFIFAIVCNFSEVFAFKKSNSCPDGFISSGNTCFRTVTQQPQDYCPYGNLINGECVKEYPATVSCPVGYSKNQEGNRTSCVSFANTPTQKFCQDGSFDGSMCKKEVFVNRICPSGTHDSGKMCAIFNAAEPVCPTGYEFKENKLLNHKVFQHKLFEKLPLGKCVKSKTVDLVKTCSDGFQMKENKCIRFVAETPKCHNFSKFVNGQCVTQKPVVTRCPHGFNAVNDKCIRQQIVNAKPYCETSWHLSGEGTCQKTELPSGCPRNAIQDTNGMCLESVEPKITCPDSYHLDLSIMNKNNACVKRKTNPLVPYCRKGYTVEGNSCVKIRQAEFSCPLGAKETRDGCVIMHNAKLACPDETEQHSLHFLRENKNKMCSQTVLIAPKPVCTKGFDYSAEHGTCTKTLTVSANKICNYGKIEKHSCVEYVYHKPEVFCPDHYEMVNDSCRMVRPSSCSTVKYETRCDTVKCTGKDCPKDIISEGGFNVIKSNNYPIEYVSDKSTNCVRVPISRVRDCNKVVFDRPQQKCSFGTLSDGMCLEIKVTEATYGCSRGTLLHGNVCKYVEEKEVVYTCPDGAELINDTDDTTPKCSFVKESKPQYVCSAGTLVDGNRCAEYVTSKELKPIVTKMPLQYGCQNGFKRHLHFFGDSFVCVKEVSVEPTEACESSFEYRNGYCVRYVNPLSPRVQTKECQWMCPKGAKTTNKFVSKKPQCTVIETVEKLTACMDYGSTLVDGNCVKYVKPVCKNENCVIVEEREPTSACPEKAKLLDKSKCDLSLTKDYELKCRSGEFVDSENMCKKYVSKVCPANTVDSGNGCFSYSVFDPQYQCMKGTTMINGKCGLETTVDYKCNKGEVVTSSGMCLTKFQAERKCPENMNFVNGACEMKVYQEPEKHKLFKKK